MSDLIRREDALALRDKLADIIGALPMSSIYSALSEYRNAIRALPAVQPDADELVGHMTKLIAAGLDRVEQLTAERDRLREAGSNAAKALRLIAGMDLMSASAVAFNAARELEAALKGESHE